MNKKSPNVNRRINKSLTESQAKILKISYLIENMDVASGPDDDADKFLADPIKAETFAGLETLMISDPKFMQAAKTAQANGNYDPIGETAAKVYAIVNYGDGYRNCEAEVAMLMKEFGVKASDVLELYNGPGYLGDASHPDSALTLQAVKEVLGRVINHLA